MINSFKNSRRDLRERAFQALFSLEFGGELLSASEFAFTYDMENADEAMLDLPVFLLNLVKGVQEHQKDLDQVIAGKLKAGWSLPRLTINDRTLLRLGLYEIKYFSETPERVAVNEIIEIAKKYSDDTSAKFVNGLLSQFVTEAELD